MGDAFRQDFIDIYEFLTFIEVIFANEFAIAAGFEPGSAALANQVTSFRESIARRFPTGAQAISTLRSAISHAHSQLVGIPLEEREKQIRALFERELHTVLRGGKPDG
jgi:hypothetical protein